MTKFKTEMKVGILVSAALLLTVALSWLIGFENPLNPKYHLYLTYHFAGGIEVGSPVRVSGIKVGRVEQIEFFTPVDPHTVIGLKEPGSVRDELDKKTTVPLKIKISLRKDVAKGIKTDSRFYINLAGIIGERYIEITPGSDSAAPLESGQMIAGIDPPRIDQLISQGFNVAGQISDLIEKNKSDISESIQLIFKLSKNLNQIVGQINQSQVFKSDLGLLTKNLISITSDVKKITNKVNTPEGEKTLQLLYDLLWRLEPLNKDEIRKFLQKEGVKVKLF